MSGNITRTCTNGHQLRYDTEHYDSPRWVHVSVSELMSCTSWPQVYANYPAPQQENRS